MKKKVADLIFGIHAVQHILLRSPHRILELFIVSTNTNNYKNRINTLLAEAKAQGITVQAVNKSSLDKWFPDQKHQGVAARIVPQKCINEADLPVLLKKQANPLFLVLDEVQDPHNLGACLRTADAAGAVAIIVPKDRSVGLTPTVKKVACGAAESVPLIQVSNLSRTLKELQSHGVWIIGTAADAEQSLYKVDLSGPIALVLGAEGSGMRKLTQKHCDYLVYLPMFGQVESLNVSVTAGICLYEACRQRRY